MSVNVKYKNTSIAELTDTGTKTLKTAGKYCEADIIVENTKDSGAEITDGIVVKARDADGFPTEATVYGEIYPYQFSYAGTYYHDTIGWKNLAKLTLTGQTVLAEGCFAYLPLTELVGIEQITKVDDSCFANTKLTQINLPNAEFKTSDYARQEIFSGNTVLERLICPKLAGNLTRGTIPLAGGCTALKEVVLGSVGYLLKDNNSINAFRYCTQSDLTITVYTNGANVDALLTHIRNGATNATIILKAAEATTYNDTSFAAGDTIITSTVEVTS